MEIQPFYGGLILPVPKCSTDGQAHSGRNSPEVGVGPVRPAAAAWGVAEALQDVASVE